MENMDMGDIMNMMGKNPVKKSEDEEALMAHKICEHINTIDPELKDRFKALQSIAFEMDALDQTEQDGIKELELEYEEKYKEIYALREALINEKAQIDMELVKAFDARLPLIQDEDYKKLEVMPCDVKSIQNLDGVSDFWIRAMLNH